MSAITGHLTHPKYRRDIDGLRAVAVLSVVGYHASKNWITGGFVGVDIFFVISGFLISSILFSSLESGRFSYAEFYARRIKRIFPALVLVLFISLFFGWYVLLPDEFKQLGMHIAAGAGFVSNIALWSEAGYFDRAAEVKPLLHLWSLGVEEQFYILWPLLLGLLWSRKINFVVATSIVALLSFSINIYWVTRYPDAAFFLPFSRIWQLMFGGILAYVSLHRPNYLPESKKVLATMSLLGVMLIGLSVGLLTEHTSYPGWFGLAPTVGAFLIIAGGPCTWINRYLLGNRMMVWVGLISYPLYLWHWPILSYMQIIEGQRPSFLARVSAVGVSILLAWGTYVLVEKRFKQRYSPAAIVFLSIAMTFSFVCGAIVWKGWFPPRNYSVSIEPFIAAANDWDYPGQLRPMVWQNYKMHVKNGSESITLFFGDSHVEQYAPRIVKVINENPDYNTAVFATAGGCRPIPNVYELNNPQCPDLIRAAISYMEQPDVDTVVIGGAWNLLFLEHTRENSAEIPSGSSYYYQANGEKHLFRGGGGAELALQELERFLNSISQSKRVFLLLDNPYGSNFSPDSFFEGSRLTRLRGSVTFDQEAIYPAEQRQLRDTLIDIAKRSGAIVIDPAKPLCSSQKCRVTTGDGSLIYKDKSHFRPFFVEEEADYLDVTVR